MHQLLKESALSDRKQGDSLHSLRCRHHREEEENRLFSKGVKRKKGRERERGWTEEKRGWIQR